ncbi:NTP transferase domain-containing protein [Sanguibacter sp. 25GB23B1]|uniref:molybdenum cofactor guanylyltransferase n=1 Tax=unclassified Sanguibacter TaxID=2645534 RepID=UPI0032AFF0B5
MTGQSDEPSVGSAVPPYDAIVLAGGRATRLGGDKPNVHVGGRRLLDHVLEATTGARRVVVVGPDDLLATRDSTDGPVTSERFASTPVTSTGRVSVAREDPPFGGPVAGLAAGLARLAERSEADTDTDGAPTPVLLLACDVPLAPRLVPDLLRAWTAAHDEAAPRTAAQAETTHGDSRRDGGRPDGICVESGGRAQWLVGVYDARALRRALAAVAAARGIDGASVKQLVGHLALRTIPDPQALSADVDTWHDVERIDSRLAEGDPR